MMCYMCMLYIDVLYVYVVYRCIYNMPIIE